METTDISFYSMAVGLLLMLVPFYYLWKLKTGLVQATVLATLRMCVQLFLIGIYLRYLFVWDNAWLNSFWVILMVFVAILIGFLVTAFLVGFYFLGLVLGLENIFSARYFVPIMGILLGNMLSVNVVALSTYYNELQREQQMYYYLLGNGATRFEATMPFLRSAVVKAFSPCIANMAVLGIVSLPGTMIGQILGGSAPDTAIKYQLMIVVITVVASMLSLMITVNLSGRKAFDEYGRLKHVFRHQKSRYNSLELF